MTAITQNLPWFIKDLGVSIVGEKCYTSLVENLNVTDGPCLKYALSKGLGVGIVVGGSIMKVPQILLIINANSARGLSLPAYILETLSYAITLAYSIRHTFPFSTYGENLFLALQNTLITFLIILYTPHSPRRLPKLGATALAAVTTTYTLAQISKPALAYLQMLTLPLSLFSKFPQIRQNARAKSTGQLSAFAVISQIVGCLARLFTTATEVDDILVLAGFALALVLNIVLGAQLYSYWGKADSSNTTTNTSPAFEHELKDLGNGSGRLGGVAGKNNEGSDGVSLQSSFDPPRAAASATGYQQHELLSPTGRVATPPIRQGTPTGARKWSRKVD